MDSKDALDQDERVQHLDMEVARLVAKVERLKAELVQAEEELRQRRDEDMEARRSVLTQEPMRPDAEGLGDPTGPRARGQKTRAGDE